jgi:SAM-dependent methyltransferase
MWQALVIIVASIALAVSEKPAKQPPAELLDGYTQGGTIPLASFFVDDTNNGEETHYVFTEKNIESYFKGTRKSFMKIYMDYERYLDNEDFDRTLMRQPKIEWIYYAMKRFASSIKDSSVLVFGSTEPYIEVAALELGAKHVTTVEYNNLTYMHNQITTFSAHRFPELYACHGVHRNAYDVALSISSFDHDGLGRYGDPLDPTGDLKAMSRAMGLLRPGGLLLLTVPIGPDLVVWNLLRRYGEKRLPLLLDGWEIVERLFWDEARVTAPESNFRKSYEPVLVLRKPLDATAWLCNEAESGAADVAPGRQEAGTDAFAEEM